MTETLPARAIAWVRAAVPDAREVRVLERFAGATSSSLHALEVEREGAPPLSLVLRRYTDAQVRAKEPQYPRTEASALRMLEEAEGILAPRLVAYDETGEACDVPAVLMSRLDGRPTIAPEDVSGWVGGLAQALASVHRLDGAGLDEVYQRWHNPRTVEPPEWSRQPRSWARLIEASRTLEPAGEVTLLHRDYHPGNVLWKDGTVSGIVDWPNACRGVPAIDVGHCRRNTVSTHGVEVAEAFLAAYGAASGRPPSALCDAICLLDSAWAPVLPAYHAYGRTDLTDDIMHARLDEYAVLIASRL